MTSTKKRYVCSTCQSCVAVVVSVHFEPNVDQAKQAAMTTEQAPRWYALGLYINS
jgi:hypothetical protein